MPSISIAENKVEIKNISDIDVLVRLRLDFFTSGVVRCVEDKSALESQLRKYFTKHLAKSDLTCYAAEVDKSIVSAAFLIIEDRPPGPHNPNGRCGTVLNEFTYPERGVRDTPLQ